MPGESRATLLRAVPPGAHVSNPAGFWTRRNAAGSVEIAGQAEAKGSPARADLGGPACGESRVPGILQPGAPAHDALAAVAVLPGRAVGRRTLVAVMPAVAYPFPDIAEHVVEAERVRREG